MERASCKDKKLRNRDKTFNMQNRVVAGIDIGGTNSIISFVSSKGDILGEIKLSTVDYAVADDFVADAASAIVELCEKRELKLSGIGIGAPNGNYYTGSIEFAPNLKWEGVVPLAELFSDKFDVPVRLTNDANAAAIGEMLFGGAKGMKDFIVVTLGTGLGSGIVVNGKVLYGHDGFAGELGHTIVKDSNRLCGCGRLGCLETYASATGIVTTARKFIAEQESSDDAKRFGTEPVTSHSIYVQASNGNRLAQKAFEYTGEILGKSLANTVALFSPEAIFLFGGLANAGDMILEPVKRHMEANMLNIFRNKVVVKRSELDEHQAAVLGAAALVWDILNR
jgi:glucokinase